MRIHALPQLPTSTSIINQDVLGRHYVRDYLYPPISIRVLRAIRDSFRGTTFSDVFSLLKRLSHPQSAPQRTLPRPSCSPEGRRHSFHLDMALRGLVLMLPEHLNIPRATAIAGVLICVAIGLILIKLRRDPLLLGEIRTNTAEAEILVLYCTRIGDYLQLLAGLEQNVIEQKEYCLLSLQVYEDAIEISEETLPPSNTIRMLLALSSAKLCYDMNFTRRAREILIKALDEAVNEVLHNLDALGIEPSQETLVTLQLLKVHLLWMNAEPGN